LNFRGERQKVISSNIANINTPNYKTQDLVFEDELKNSSFNNTLQLKQTDSKHISSINSLSNFSNPKLVQVQGLEEQNDGNNVNLDSQMGEQSKNKIIFDAIQSSIKRDSKLFRSVIESSSKN
jgi:flagellar basal-body rod protein FlgB